jgi:basic membrane protein A
MKHAVRSIPALPLALLALASCSAPADCFREEVFCAALVTDTLGVDDHGPNRDSWIGLEQARTTGEAQRIEFIESIDPRDYEKNLAYFARRGFDVILASGSGLRDETLEAADLFPDQVFIGINQAHDRRRPNLVPVTFAEDQMGFLAGALAARLTRTRVVAAVCETSAIDSMWRYCEGFRAGVRHEDDQARVLVKYRNDGPQESLFIDEAWGGEQARALIGQGADVIFAAGGETAQGALRAASEAEIHAIGTERDQAAALGQDGSSVVTSFIGRPGPELRDLIRRLRQGDPPEPLTGRFGLVPLGEEFPESLSLELDSLRQQLDSNVVRTNVSREAP